MDLQQAIFDKSKSVEFRRTIGIVEATTIGVGSLMGAGLYVLVGIASAQAGPGLWIAYAICGALTFLSVLMYGEFAGRLPISGGGYIYAYRTLGSFWGFTVGWHLAVGSIFACALYAYGFASYLASILPGSWANAAWIQRLIAVALVAVLIALGVRGGKGGDRLQRLFTWGNLVILIILAVIALSYAKLSNLTPMMPNGIGGIGAAISLIYISFFGYQLVANSAEEINDAPRTVPRAMLYAMVISTFFYLLIALTSLAAIDWSELAKSDTPLVLVASRGIGPSGIVLVAIGGVLASGAALNGTLLSQGRQIYAMGRDRLLPELVSRVDKETKVPKAALVAGAVATIVVVLIANVTFIAKAANFALLFSMLPISVALHRLMEQGEAPSAGAPRTLDREPALPTGTAGDHVPTGDSLPTGTAGDHVPTRDSLPTSTAGDHVPTRDSLPTSTAGDHVPTRDSLPSRAGQTRSATAALGTTTTDEESPAARPSLWRRALPWAALVSNLALLFTLDWQSLLFGGTVIGAGCFVFIIYSYSSEKRGQAGFSVALDEEESTLGFLKRGERILVPMANPRTQESLFSISQALLSSEGGEVIVLSVVKADQAHTPRAALQDARFTTEAVQVIERVQSVAQRDGVEFRPVVRAAKDLAQGISHAALEEKCSLIVMGWAAQDDSSPSKLLEDVVRNSRTDTIFLQLTEDKPPRRIGVSLGGLDNLPLMVRVAGTLADQYRGQVVYLNVMPEYFEKRHLDHAREVHVQALRHHRVLVPFSTEVLHSDSPLEAIVERTRELDLLVIGSTVRTSFEQNEVGAFASMLARRAHCSVVIVRRSLPSVLGRAIQL